MSTRPLDRLADLVANPDRIEELPREDLPDLLSELEGVRARLQLELSKPQDSTLSEDDPDSRSDRLLDAEEVAKRLDVTERYVYDHADEWPFTRRISPRKLRFSEQGLYRWLETRT